MEVALVGRGQKKHHMMRVDSHPRLSLSLETFILYRGRLNLPLS